LNHFVGKQGSNAIGIPLAVILEESKASPAKENNENSAVSPLVTTLFIESISRASESLEGDCENVTGKPYIDGWDLFLFG
jgi:hypothetical protein